jgi:hypothetical protein
MAHRPPIRGPVHAPVQRAAVRQQPAGQGGAAQHDDKLGAVAVANEVERPLHRLVGLATRRRAQVRGELVQHRVPELLVLRKQRQQEGEGLGEIAGGEVPASGVAGAKAEAAAAVLVTFAALDARVRDKDLPIINATPSKISAATTSTAATTASAVPTP